MNQSILKINVTAKYTVGLGGLEVPENIYKGLLQIEENGGYDSSADNEDVHEACEWLEENIRERDCCDIDYEINNLEEQV